MRIETLRPNSVAPAKRPGGRIRAGGFSDLVSVDEDVAPRAAGPMLGITSLSTLLDVQNVQERTEPRRQTQTQISAGHETLDMLGHLQRALALGGASVTVLQKLSARASAQAGMSDDPQLNDILAEINLRLAVETAKLEMAHGALVCL
jgi:hypothetical protein